MRYLILFCLLLVAPVAAQEYERPELADNVSDTIVSAFHTAAKKALELSGGPEPDRAVATVESPGGGRQITVRAYAYCLRGRTASGTYVDRGTVAVDPRVIPLGTKLFIPGYGHAKALDTGGAIQGNKIDLWMPSSGDCYAWGVRTVTITVFD